MRLLDRYLLRELLLPLGYCLSGFFIFWASADLITNLDSYQEDKLSLLDLVQFYFFRAPEFLVVVIPMALLLAMLGLFAMIAYSVAQRRAEFGIRLTFGATPDSIRRLVISGGADGALTASA